MTHDLKNNTLLWGLIVPAAVTAPLSALLLAATMTMPINANMDASVTFSPAFNAQSVALGNDAYRLADGTYTMNVTVDNAPRVCDVEIKTGTKEKEVATYYDASTVYMTTQNFPHKFFTLDCA